MGQHLKPTGRDMALRDLGAWTTNLPCRQLVRIDDEGGKPLEQGHYIFRAHVYFGRVIGLYDFHAGDAPHVRVQAVLSEGDNGEVVDEYHKAIKLRFREKMSRFGHGFRCHVFKPPERILKPSYPSALMANCRCTIEELAAVDRPDWFAVSHHDYGSNGAATGSNGKGPVGVVMYEGRAIGKTAAMELAKEGYRPFFSAALKDVYAQVANSLKTQIVEAMAVPDYLIWGDGKSEVSQNLLRIYRPLKVVPTFHDGYASKKVGCDMSMKCTVSIVGAGYHPGANECLRNLERQFNRGKEHPFGPYPDAHRAKLTLVREPDNAHDPNAVAIHFLGRMLGYVPRQDAKVVAKVMDAGVMVRAKYNGGNTASLWWPASTKEGVDAAYRIAMAEGEGL